MISSTNTVMIAIVITRFVAILSSLKSVQFNHNWYKGNKISPTRHPPQRLHTAVDIALALLQIAMCVFNHIPLLMEVCQRASADGFRLQRYSLGLPQSL
jgi:hypothetical protein